MHFSTLYTFFVTVQVILVSALPPQLLSAKALASAIFTPSEPIDGWPFSKKTSASTTEFVTVTINGLPQSDSSTSSSSTTEGQVTSVTTIFVTDTRGSTGSIGSSAASSSSTHTFTGIELTETFTITCTSYTEATIWVPPAAISTGPVSQIIPSFTVVTVTESTASGELPPWEGTPSFTIVTVTATPSPWSQGQTTGTPWFTTITVSEVTIWPTPSGPTPITTPTTTSMATPIVTPMTPVEPIQSSLQTSQASQLVTLTMTSSSVNLSLNATIVSYSSTVMTLNPPPSFATGTATIGTVRRLA
ncbi:hypothetical protein GGR50DRAFT_701230 [Xylaria sp. CBS 124048]|nr:hypothetical protein GGR50DRAFT_701230 [Xylaria sp. CBS 124048]